MKQRERGTEINRKIIVWFIASLFINGLFIGLLSAYINNYGGNMRVVNILCLTGFPLILITTLICFFRKSLGICPFIIAFAMQIQFLIAGYITGHFYNYFLVIFLTTGLLAILKLYKQMASYIICVTVVNIVFSIIFVADLEGISQLAFFGMIIMTTAGTFIMFLLTYRIAIKDENSNQAIDVFSALLHKTPNLMVITDTDAKVRYISKPMTEFAFYSSQELAVGKPLIDLFIDIELKLMFADILDTDGFIETVMSIEVNNETRDFKVIADRLSGSKSGLFIDISDITPLTHSIMEAAEAKALAEDAQNRAEAANESKSKFLANMSHEIRTPMNAILGITEIELENDDNAPEIKLSLRKIYNSGYTLLGLINDILDLSKIESNNLELVPVEYDSPSIVNDTIVQNIGRIGSKPIEFDLFVAENVPSRLFGDELRIKQVLSNLLSNAFKYTEKGMVKLEVSIEALGEGNAWLILSVSDTGQGMSEEHVALLFEEYSRFNQEANRLTEGAGLGMSITKNLIELMDGKIDIKSELGVGTTITVYLKQKVIGNEVIGKELANNLKNYHYANETQMERRKVSREYMPYGSVLIVDDVETNLYVARGLMTPYGLKIETVLSGFEALDLIDAGKSYDIVFMDHMMPKMDGIETVRLMREKGYAQPVVALTANAVIGQSEMFFENGFDDFISKPIDVRQLNAVLNRLIRDKQPPEVLEKARAQKGKRKKKKTETVNEDIVDETEEAFEIDIDEIVDVELNAIFARDAKKSMEIFRSVFDNLDNVTKEDLASFTTNAHAMKSALGNIGELGASKWAAALEDAGRNEVIEIIKADTPEFMENLLLIIEKCEPKTVYDDENIEEDLELLTDKLGDIQMACAEYDDRPAKAALTVLKEHLWKEEVRQLLENISQYLLHSDFELAEDEAKKAIEKYK